MQDRLSARAIWALGATQIIGYGTLYYSFSVLAPDIGLTFGWSPEWVFGALSIALLAGAFSSPVAGRMVDRFGAARTMTAGSIAAAVMLVGMALAPSGYLFAAALIGMELTATLVLYAAAFAAIVQLGGQTAQRSITHLTLIAGFASTIFWPLTATLLTWIDWRAVYLVFAALNLLVCAPLHASLGASGANPTQVAVGPRPSPLRGTLAPRHRQLGFVLMLLGFTLEGLVLSAVLLQIVPLLTGLSLGTGMLLVTSLFGPAQVLSRLVNMIAGKGLPATGLAIIAALFATTGPLLLGLTAPSLAGAVAFAIIFGLGSGLTSIVAGTLPLHVLGSENYGARLGWMTAARQTASAVAPFIMAAGMSAIGIHMSLWSLVGLGMASVIVFVALAALARPARQLVRLEAAAETA